MGSSVYFTGISQAHLSTVALQAKRVAAIEAAAKRREAQERQREKNEQRAEALRQHELQFKQKTSSVQSRIRVAEIARSNVQMESHSSPSSVPPPHTDPVAIATSALLSAPGIGQSESVSPTTSSSPSPSPFPRAGRSSSLSVPSSSLAPQKIPTPVSAGPLPINRQRAQSLRHTPSKLSSNSRGNIGTKVNNDYGGTKGSPQSGKRADVRRSISVDVGETCEEAGERAEQRRQKREIERKELKALIMVYRFFT